MNDLFPPLLVRVCLFKSQSHQVVARKKRPFVMVTSTSYTPDEDLRILLRALNTLDRDLQDRVGEWIQGPGSFFQVAWVPPDSCKETQMWGLSLLMVSSTW